MEHGDGTDVFSFTVGDDGCTQVRMQREPLRLRPHGRTRVRMQREGSEVFKLK